MEEALHVLEGVSGRSCEGERSGTCISEELRVVLVQAGSLSLPPTHSRRSGVLRRAGWWGGEGNGR